MFFLNYCIEDSFKRKKPLYVVAIDYSKAFDSVKRKELIEAIKTYRTHPDIINAVANIYMNDFTSVRLNGQTEEKITVISGIRQGCTGSTVLFKIVTYIIMRQLTATKLGFRNRKIYLPLLFFADDGLILSQSVVEMKVIITKMVQTSSTCGLKNKQSKMFHTSI